jgi:hypothetical protein
MISAILGPAGMERAKKELERPSGRVPQANSGVFPFTPTAIRSFWKPRVKRARPAGARQHGWAAYLEERVRIPAVAVRTLSPLVSRFLGQVRENGVGL